MPLRHREIQERGTGGRGRESIDDTVLYYFMPASIEKESVR